MARLPALVDALVPHDPRSKATLAHIARQVRDEDLIDSRKRGAGAAVMTFADAATLLMGAYGSATPQGAAEAVNNLRVLQPAPWDKTDRTRHEEMPERLGFLRKRMSFADALEALITNAPALAIWETEYLRSFPLADDKEMSAAEYSMQRTMWKFQNSRVFATLPLARVVRVVCYAPGLAAEVHLGLIWRQLEEDNSFHEFYAPAQAWKPSLAGSSSEDGRRETALTIMEFALPTLLALHHAVAGGA